MRQRCLRRGWPVAAALAMLVLAPGCTLQTHAQPAGAPVINVVAVGTGMTAGEGMEPYRDARGQVTDRSPDDTHDPATVFRPSQPGEPRRTYRPTGRSPQAWPAVVYQRLGSRGFYVNRAASSIQASDLLPLVDGLVVTDYSRVDLVLLDIGANDVGFGDIAEACFHQRDGQGCDQLLSTLEGTGLRSLRQLIFWRVTPAVAMLMERFPRAQFVWAGYFQPEETLQQLSFCKSPAGVLTSWPCGADQMVAFDPVIRLHNLMVKAEQYFQVAAGFLRNIKGGRITYHSLLELFQGHGVDHANPAKPGRWLFADDGPAYLPTKEGQNQIATSVLADPTIARVRQTHPPGRP